MKWHVSILYPDDSVLLAGKAESQEQADAVANFAVDNDPSLRAFVKAPAGNVREYRYHK